jgi:hypothetical protein
VNNLEKLEINRLIKELDFVKSDLNYKSELLSEADHHFMKSVSNFLDSHPHLKQVFEERLSKSNDNVSINKGDNLDSNENESIIEENKEPKLKNLYRKIAKTTHPDKLKDDNLKELYLEATSAYETNNILAIFAVCDKLKIPYDVTEEEFNLLKKEIKSVKNQVVFLETTFTWQWFNQEDTKNKDLIILNFIKSQMSL